MVRQQTGRKRDAARTKAAILQSAISEFALRGPAGTRVDEIAARAGVNKSLIYQYFGSKQELYAEALFASLKTITEKSEKATLNVAKADSLEDLQVLVRGYLEAHLSMLEMVPEYPRLLAWENLEGGRTLARLPIQNTYQNFLKTITGILHPLRERGLITGDFDLNSVAQSIMALTHYFLIHRGTLKALFNMDPDVPETRERWLDYCTDMMMASFIPLPGKRSSAEPKL